MPPCRACLARPGLGLRQTVGACRVTEQYRHDHKERRGAQADGVDHHDVRKGAEVREHAEYPIEADAADTDHGDEGRHERDAKAAQVTGHVFVEHAKGVCREDRAHADIADRDDVGIAVKERQDLAPQTDDDDDGGECNDAAFDQADLERLGATVDLARAVVLSHKGSASLAKAVEQVVTHILQAHGSAGCRHDLGAQAVDGGLDDDVGDGKDGALDAGGQADLNDALEGDGV